MKFFILLLSLSCLSVQADTVYRWVEKNGVVHYSDKYVAGAEKMRIDVAPSNKSVDPPPNLNQSSQAQAKPLLVAEKSNTKYQTSISSPEHDSTIHDNNGTISVNTLITPALEAEQSIQLLIDGTPMGEKQQSTTLSVTGIDRGSHSLQVQLFDQGGKIIASSEIITVHLRRASAK